MEQSVHRCILEPITRIQQQQQQQGRDDDECSLCSLLMIQDACNVDRHSVQYLVDFLNEDTCGVTHLELNDFHLLQPSDGGFQVLRDYFENQTTVAKVTLVHSDFGSTDEASQLIAALHTNRSVTDLTIYNIRNLEGAAFGNCISGVLQNAVHLQRLELGWLNAEVIRAFQPGLRAIHRNLKELNLSRCTMGDVGLRLIVDALVGNTTMEILDFSNNNDITSNGLANITRLVASTQLKTINVSFNRNIFTNNNAVQKFIRTTLFQNTSLDELPGVDLHDFPEIDDILTRNRGLKYATALLALQPGTRMPIGSKSGIWYIAFAKLTATTFCLGLSPSHGAVPAPGASVIFKILQARPVILEKQLRRPATFSSRPQHGTTQGHQRDPDDGSGGVGSDTNHTFEATTAERGKRRRM